MTSGGTVFTYNGNKVSKPILLKKGETVKVKTKGNGNYWFNFVSKVPSLDSVIADHSVDIINLGVIDDNSLKEYSYTATEDIPVILCGMMDSTTEVTFENVVKVSRIDNLKETSDNLSDEIDSVDEKVNGIVVDYNSVNKFNTNDSTIGTNGFIRYGEVVQASGYIYSHKIKANAGDTVRITYHGDFVGNIGSGYDANGNVVVSILGGTPKDNNRYLECTIPSSAENLDYILVNGTDAIRANYMCVINADYPSIYIAYVDEKRLSNGIKLNDTQIEQIGSGTQLTGKKLAVDGDSICYGHGYLGGYAKIIGENNSMTVQNLGISGGTLVNRSGSHCISTSMANLDNDADFVIIEGGVNDASIDGITLGSITNGYTDTLDNTTFYGAMELVCKTLVNQFNGKKYGYIIVHQMCNGMRPNGQFYNAVVECCKKWGVPLLDLSIEIPPFAYLPDSVKDLYTADTDGSGHGDGWHPNEDGYRKYYVPKIEAWMKTL